MDGMNRVTLFGNLGRAPELRFTQSGQAVLALRLATTESYLDKNRARQERTDWHNVIVWGKRGEALARILHQGSQLLVEGSLRTSSYEKNGEKRYKTEVLAQKVYLSGRRPEQNGQPQPEDHPGYGPGADAQRARTNGGAAGGAARPSQAGTPHEPPPADDEGPIIEYGSTGGDDDIPF